MPDVPTVPPELCRSVSALARMLVAAARSWALYPPEHPAVGGALERVRAAVAALTARGPFSFGITPDTLLVDGVPLTGRDGGAVAEAAAWLNGRDLLQITFEGPVDVGALQRLLSLLCEDAGVIRQHGGPERVWASSGDPSIQLKQIDFSRVLADGKAGAAPRPGEDVWRSIARSAGGGHGDEFGVDGDAADPSPQVTAAVDAYQNLVGIVNSLSPDARAAVAKRFGDANQSGGATAGAGDGDRHVALPGGASTDAFDDSKVAELLATTLAIEGHASHRLAVVFDTIAPDPDRKQRVLSLARRMLSETDFGQRVEFDALWTSMQELLLTYNDRAFVSDDYRASLDGLDARAARMAAGDLPPDLVALIDTLSSGNVRRLSITLLVDLLSIEADSGMARELARDAVAMAEELLTGRDYESALQVVTSLAGLASAGSAAAAAGSRSALDSFVMSPPFRQAAAQLGEMSDDGAQAFAQTCLAIGPACTEALRDQLGAAAMTPGRIRAASILRAFGARAVARLAPLVVTGDWSAQRACAELLGEIGAPEGVPLLQSLLRSRDARVIRAGVHALLTIGDHSSARALHAALRNDNTDQRRAVITAIVAEHDARVVPILVQILQELDPFGSEHLVVLDTIVAIAQIGDDQAVPALASLMRRRKLLDAKKSAAVARLSMHALRAIQTPAATRALQEAVAGGDRLLRRIARSDGLTAHG
jgi:HEAT repeat protein